MKHKGKKESDKESNITKFTSQKEKNKETIGKSKNRKKTTPP